MNSEHPHLSQKLFFVLVHVLPKHSISFFFFLFIYLFIYFLIVVGFVIHWNESAMDLHVFPYYFFRGSIAGTLCGRTEHLFQIYCFTALFPGRTLCTFWWQFSFVLWVLFHLESVLWPGVDKVHFVEMRNFLMCQFWKCYGNTLVFITYTRLEQKPNRAKCEW